MGAIGTRFGAEWGIRAAAIIVVAVAAGMWRAQSQVESNLDSTVKAVVEEESLRTLVSQGKHLPLLGIRGVDFSYGQLQVLFDVDFTVDDGEMVALLGTNGAGKSTLLRVISGLGFPTQGTVHYRGSDITFLDSVRRVQFGIVQISGGRAVFGSLTVAENLRTYGYSLGRSGRTIDGAMDTIFEVLPILGERRNQLASTMSGGEQQMLGIAKALLLKPRLLLIDELSLGLAPKVTSALLRVVRRINDEGTAIVLVEQSVNIALSLVHHAYFMEKGKIRFDGVASDLLDREDLLRSVFLKGAAATFGLGEPS
jgi:ABC-type branched-subunit amino acid transport system ATPase component